MLVLTRRHDESLIFETAQGPIEVVLLKVRPNSCRLGINAPATVKVIRKELPLKVSK